MKGIRRHIGKAVLMLTDNINTDQIIPSREMKSVSRFGLADGLFANLRYLDAAAGGRIPDPDFVLNQYSCRGASILISASNFGCGSSREHAVWALHEYGFRVIIATSFGSIFYENCINNGIIPIVLDTAAITQLTDALDRRATNITVDLEHCLVSVENVKLNFSLNEDKRHMLLNGSNAIDLTLRHKPAIDQFLRTDKNDRPWVYDYMHCELPEQLKTDHKNTGHREAQDSTESNTQAKSRAISQAKSRGQTSD